MHRRYVRFRESANPDMSNSVLPVFSAACSLDISFNLSFHNKDIVFTIYYNPWQMTAKY